MKSFLRAVFLFIAFVGTPACLAAESLPQTKALDWPEEDISSRMMDGAHRFAERQVAAAKEQRARFWKYDNTSAESWERSVAENRERFKKIIGAVNPRLSPRMERFGDD